jgi:hypothetical protein
VDVVDVCDCDARIDRCAAASRNANGRAAGTLHHTPSPAAAYHHTSLLLVENTIVNVAYMRSRRNQFRHDCILRRISINQISWRSKNRCRNQLHLYMRVLVNRCEAKQNVKQMVFDVPLNDVWLGDVRSISFSNREQCRSLRRSLQSQPRQYLNIQNVNNRHGNQRDNNNNNNN